MAHPHPHATSQLRGTSTTVSAGQRFANWQSHLGYKLYVVSAAPMGKHLIRATYPDTHLRARGSVPFLPAYSPSMA